ncbi:hypothetical protein [Ectobacillus ponti]|uniref:DUF5067 domain-containing protein n=1 Tax=Ectobacillus ponti TaxID=2961894 RepID=A0AA41X4N0_9BACI|nr:hypothetical protein [Ectobacillus ponti]MCP8968672.1 hypothetical protein [Ectobacillus ponti]
MRKIGFLGLSVLLASGLLSGCGLFQKEEPKPEPPAAADQQGGNSGQQGGNLGGQQGDRLGGQLGNQSGEQPSQTYKDVFEQYKIYQFITSFNDAGTELNMSLSKPSVYKETDTFIVFDIPANNGCYVDVFASKATGKYYFVGITSPGIDADSYKAFYSGVVIMLFLLDPSMTSDRSEALLGQLGYGTSAVQLNHKISFGNATIEVSYDSASERLYFGYKQPDAK